MNQTVKNKRQLGEKPDDKDNLKQPSFADVKMWKKKCVSLKQWNMVLAFLSVFPHVFPWDHYLWFSKYKHIYVERDYVYHCINCILNLTVYCECVFHGHLFNDCIESRHWSAIKIFYVLLLQKYTEHQFNSCTLV